MSKGANKATGRSKNLLHRRGRPRFIKRTILIVCESSETEPNYFRELQKRDLDTDRIALTIRKKATGCPEKTVRQAIIWQEQREDKYDEVWCVLDVEDTQNRAALDKAISLADLHDDIELCLSNPSFEVWFLAHFVRISREFENADAVISKLNTYWKKVSKDDYSKTDARIYERISDRTSKAVKNAKHVRERTSDSTADCNSSTDVCKLVQSLLPLDAHP